MGDVPYLELLGGQRVWISCFEDDRRCQRPEALHIHQHADNGSHQERGCSRDPRHFPRFQSLAQSSVLPHYSRVTSATAGEGEGGEPFSCANTKLTPLPYPPCTIATSATLLKRRDTKREGERNSRGISSQAFSCRNRK